MNPGTAEPDANNAQNAQNMTTTKLPLALLVFLTLELKDLEFTASKTQQNTPVWEFDNGELVVTAEFLHDCLCVTVEAGEVKLPMMVVTTIAETDQLIRIVLRECVAASKETDERLAQEAEEQREFHDRLASIAEECNWERIMVSDEYAIFRSKLFVEKHLYCYVKVSNEVSVFKNKPRLKFTPCLSDGTDSDHFPKFTSGLHDGIHTAFNACENALKANL